MVAEGNETEQSRAELDGRACAEPRETGQGQRSAREACTQTQVWTQTGRAGRSGARARVSGAGPQALPSPVRGEQCRCPPAR